MFMDTSRAINTLFLIAFSWNEEEEDSKNIGSSSISSILAPLDFNLNFFDIRYRNLRFVLIWDINNF